MTPGRAAALLSDSRSLADSIGFREGVAWSLEQLGLLAASQDDPAAAIALLNHSLEIHRALQDRWRTSSVLEDLAAVTLTARGTATGTAHAAALLGAAEAIREAIGTVIPPCERPQHEETVSGAQAVLGAEAFAAAWQRGRHAQPDDLAEPPDGRAGPDDLGRPPARFWPGRDVRQPGSGRGAMCASPVLAGARCAPARFWLGALGEPSGLLRRC